MPLSELKTTSQVHLQVAGPLSAPAKLINKKVEILWLTETVPLLL